MVESVQGKAENGGAKQGAPDDDRVAKLGELIRSIRVAMLTTLEPDGWLRSRPMATQFAPMDKDGALYFFTRIESPKVDEVQKHRQVNLSYSAPDSSRYVSVSGRAYLVHDRERMKALWNPAYRAWFPQGLRDPELALLKVEVEHAEYWDTPGGMVVHVIGLVKALATGRPYAPGDHQRLDLGGAHGGRGQNGASAGATS